MLVVFFFFIAVIKAKQNKNQSLINQSKRPRTKATKEEKFNLAYNSERMGSIVVGRA